MANGEPGGSPRLRRAARLLLILSAVLAAYVGLSSLLLPFLGAPNLYPGIERWIVPAAGALQLLGAAAALVLAIRRDLRGATLAVAACLMLGWLEMLPPAIRNGLDLRAGPWLASAYFVAAPMIAFSAAALAWRTPRPILAALIVTAPTSAFLLFTLAFGVMIALYGF